MGQRSGHLVWIFVTTDIPTRIASIFSWFGASEMRTGNLCAILVKLPVAFCGATVLYVAPLAGPTLSTLPTKVGLDAVTAPRRHQCAKVGSQQSVVGSEQPCQAANACL